MNKTDNNIDSKTNDNDDLSNQGIDPDTVGVLQDLVVLLRVARSIDRLRYINRKIWIN